jgi:hypothetical protein
MTHLVKSHLFFVIIFFILFSFRAQAQITFSQSVYQVNQDVIATGTDNVQGVENSVPTGGISMQITTGTTSINLGQNPIAGIYPVTFSFSDQTKATYLIEIADNSFTIDNSIIAADANALSADKVLIFTALYKFFKEQDFSVTQKVLLNASQNFCVHNGVSVVKNVTFCFAAASADLSVEVLDAMCADLTKDNLKGLTLEVYNELFKTIHDMNYINDQQFNDLKVDDYVNLAKMLNNDCSAFFDAVADRTNAPNLKLAIKYQGQVCSSAVAIIKLYNKLP